MDFRRLRTDGGPIKSSYGRFQRTEDGEKKISEEFEERLFAFDKTTLYLGVKKAVRVHLSTLYLGLGIRSVLPIPGMRAATT